MKGLGKKLSLYKIWKGMLYLKHYGPKEFWIRLRERMEPEEVPYGPWYQAYRPKEEELAAQRQKKYRSPLCFSIVTAAYHTDPGFLKDMMDSLLAQTYPHWELCLVNASPEDIGMKKVLDACHDSRIRIQNLKENLSIADNTNEAVGMARGDWIGFMDHDDLLAPEALYMIAKEISAHPEADLVYTDEDKVTEDGEEHFQPHLKPDYNPDLLRSNNYICHFLLVKKELMDFVGGMSTEYEGAQDYDFILRCTEKASGIVHVPEILYHWRTHRHSTADNPASKMYAYEAGKRAIEAHLARVNLPGEVTMLKDFGFYRVKYPVREAPLVSILIPNKDHPLMLKRCVDSILNMTSYSHFEILIMENNSEGEEIWKLYRKLEEDPRIRIHTYEGPFNYSAINNEAARLARGSYLLFLNNDTIVLKADWMEEMLGVCQREGTGAVGVKLLYPDGTIQHAGIVIGIGGVAGSMFVGMDGEKSGYLHKASLIQDLSAVTAACMMVPKKVFMEVDGFCEKLAVAFNDVDLCLKIRQKGYLVVYDPFVCLIHDESRTRGPEDSEEKVRRFQSEIEYMRSHWIGILRKGDPMYNKNLSLSKWDYSLKYDL